MNDLISKLGYKRNSPFRFNKSLTIYSPTGNITMQDVDIPILAESNLGERTIMLPGNDYKFAGTKIKETPLVSYKPTKFQTGGDLKKYDKLAKKYLTAVEYAMYKSMQETGKVNKKLYDYFFKKIYDGAQKDNAKKISDLSDYVTSFVLKTNKQKESPKMDNYTLYKTSQSGIIPFNADYYNKNKAEERVVKDIYGEKGLEYGIETVPAVAAPYGATKALYRLLVKDDYLAVPLFLTEYAAKRTIPRPINIPTDFEFPNFQVQADSTAVYHEYPQPRVLDLGEDKPFKNLKAPTIKPIDYKSGGSIKDKMKCGEVRPSTRKGKKIMQKVCINGKEKLIHAGAKGYSDYTKHRDEERRKRFKLRHKCSEAKYGTPKWLACNKLW